ncbi:MAG: IclR family transcriptional regulator [Chloroflexi bacterium]|nr:MAG: IclR family transcriptional regulator [Chloroflexota bacterium]RLC92296.1 MAG: IclR family transcriptional regulator [Chloroflexota bacterium]
MSQGQVVKSVRRAVAILRSFSLGEPELSVTHLSRRLNVHKSTVSRLLSTLEAEGLVDRNPETGCYRLGVGLIELAGLVVLHRDLRQAARPLLRQLADQTQETVNLAVRDGNEVINIEQVVPRDRRVLNIGWVGRRTPLHASSTGKVLLAYLPEAELNALIQNPLPRFTEYTITDAQVLRAELALVRQRGYATGLEELENGLNAVAAPVRDHTGQVIATVSAAGPSYRFSREHIKKEAAAQVIACAEQISRALGFARTGETES